MGAALIWVRQSLGLGRNYLRVGGVIMNANGSTDVLELLSQLRATLNCHASANPKLIRLIEASVDADARSSMIDKRLVERLKAQVTDQFAAKRWSAHSNAAFLTISALEMSIQRRADGSE
jgi:hypothetical protein